MYMQYFIYIYLPQKIRYVKKLIVSLPIWQKYIILRKKSKNESITMASGYKHNNNKCNKLTPTLMLYITKPIVGSLHDVGGETIEQAFLIKNKLI